MYETHYTYQPLGRYGYSRDCRGEDPGLGAFAQQTPTLSYLQQVDRTLRGIQAPYLRTAIDLPSAVFANQAAEHALTSYHLAGLIHQRDAMTKRHLADIHFRLSDLVENRSILKMHNVPPGDRGLVNVERQIIDLERQEHDLERQLWQDILELRTGLLKERTDLLSTGRRVAFLTGREYGL